MRDTVPTDLPEHNQLVDSNSLKSQKYLDKINQWTEKNLMELNEKKTKSILFNFSKKYQFKTNLILKNHGFSNTGRLFTILA